MTNETMRRGTPKSIIRCMARGRAASDDVVVNAMTAGSLTARMNGPNRNPGDERRGNQRQQHEHDQRAVERPHQQPQVAEHLDPAVAHRHRHRRPDADRRVTSSRCRRT